MWTMFAVVIGITCVATYNTLNFKAPEISEGDCYVFRYENVNAVEDKVVCFWGGEWHKYGITPQQ